MMQKFENELKLRGFSNQTLRSYKLQVALFKKFIGKELNRVNKEDIKKYLGFLISEKNLSPKSIALKKAALKFFYHEVFNSYIVDFKTPKSPKKLPNYLTREEIKLLIDHAGTYKTKLIIKFLYSSGLRVSELCSLKIYDLELNSKKYLFEGYKGPLSPRNIQKIIQNASQKANLKKRVSPHVLRHSFGTHLLDDGTDIRLIQELLGHANLNTTQIYTHVSKEQLKKIKSPLDTI